MRGEEALRIVESLCDEDSPARVYYVNAHALNLAVESPDYAESLRGASLLLNDGAGIALAGRLYGRPFPENLNGSDFNPLILALARRRGWRTFLMGARPGVAEVAAQRLKRLMPGLIICGTHHGYLEGSESERIADEIRRSKTDVLMVGMGNPVQELWVDEYLPRSGARLGVGVGAFLDFSAEMVPRAPAWMNRFGMEWAFRLSREPRRLWKRYVVGNPKFLWRIARHRLGHGKVRTG
ncbi:MAG: WecB/TagA/CpsF family glycosyltransferase [Actinomycetota bacterium]|nr:WecB/TagA/CpsF family glycosyltransferase [Actinomycetota bacterium]